MVNPPQQTPDESNDEWLHHWCYGCNRRVRIETDENLPNVICRECNYGFHEFVPPDNYLQPEAIAECLRNFGPFFLGDGGTAVPPSPDPQFEDDLFGGELYRSDYDDEEDDDDDDSSDFFRMSVLVSEDYGAAPPSQDPQSHDLVFEFNGSGEEIEGENDVGTDLSNFWRISSISLENYGVPPPVDPQSEENGESEEIALENQENNGEENMNTGEGNVSFSWTMTVLRGNPISVESPFSSLNWFQSFRNRESDYVGDDGFDQVLERLVETDSGRIGAPPAAKSVVSGLPTIKILTEADAAGCAICQDVVGVGELMKKLPCGHGYHGDCIVTWLDTRNSCPVCRLELPTDDIEYEEQRDRRKSRGTEERMDC